MEEKKKPHMPWWKVWILVITAIQELMMARFHQLEKAVLHQNEIKIPFMATIRNQEITRWR